MSDYTETLRVRMPTVLISEVQYDQMLSDYLVWMNNTWNPAEEILANLTAKYQCRDRIPKRFLYIKLDPYISTDDHVFVANGIRSFFDSQLTRLFEKKQVEDSLKQVKNVFNIMVNIIGVISLTIAFFLLLISTTQNV